MPFPYSSNDIEGGIEGGKGKYPPLPVNVYEFEITDVKEKITKNGDPMVAATLEVVNNPDYAGRLVWHNVTFPAVDPKTNKRPQWGGIAIHFLKAIEEPWEEGFIVTPGAWIGKIVKAKTKIGKDQNGNEKTEIAFILGKDEVAGDEALPF